MGLFEVMGASLFACLFVCCCCFFFCKSLLFCHRESLASPLESDVLIRETLVDETRSETQTNSSAVSVIPGTLASNTTESHSKGNRLDLYNKMSLQKAGDGNSEQRTRPNLAHNKQRGKIVTASVLDDFI